MWGALAAETSDERELSDSYGGDAVLIVFALNRVAAHALSSRGATLKNLGHVEMTEELAGEIVDKVRADAEAAKADFEVVALLNAPPADLAQSATAWQGEWFGSPCSLEIRYPDDALCTLVCEGLSITHLVHGSADGHANCALQFKYSLPILLTRDETLDAHIRAGEYLRDGVDALRILYPGDIGILHMYGHAPEREEDSRLVPLFMAWFKESPQHKPRAPIRRVYDPPLPTAEISEDGVIVAALTVALTHRWRIRADRGGAER